MSLLENGGTRHEQDIARDLLSHDQSQIDYYTVIAKNMVGNFEASAQRLAEVLASLVEDTPAEKCRADWVRFEPYRVQLAAGASTTVDVIIENLASEPIDVAIRLIMAPGVTADPPTVCCRVTPGEHYRSSHEIHLSELDRTGPTILCVDVNRNGQPLGWLAECQLWHEGTPC